MAADIPPGCKPPGYYISQATRDYLLYGEAYIRVPIEPADPRGLAEAAMEALDPAWEPLEWHELPLEFSAEGKIGRSWTDDAGTAYIFDEPRYIGELSQGARDLFESKYVLPKEWHEL